MSATFPAKWPGVCPICGFSWEKGEYLHYVEGKVAHESCHAPDGSDMGPVENGSGATTFVVRGKRQPKLCGTCFTYHNGECP